MKKNEFCKQTTLSANYFDVILEPNKLLFHSETTQTLESIPINIEMVTKNKVWVTGIKNWTLWVYPVSSSDFVF